MKFTKQFVVFGIFAFLVLEIIGWYSKSFCMTRYSNIDQLILIGAILGQMVLLTGIATDNILFCGLGHFAFSFLVIVTPLVSNNKCLLLLNLLASSLALITRVVNKNCLLKELDKDVIKYPFSANWNVIFGISFILSFIKLKGW